MLRSFLLAKRVSFIKDSRGNVALLAALLALPLVGVGGLAVDHMSASSAHTRFSSAADAAALAAVNTAKAVATGNNTFGQGDPITAGVAAAQRVFSANAKNTGSATAPVINISLVANGGEFVSNVVWSTASPATFGRLFGLANVDVSGRAEARSGVGSYHDFHIVMDMSASMLIGATEPDILRTNSLLNCAFACHISSNSYSYLRSQGGVRLRLDVMKDAIVAAIEDVRRNSSPGLHRFAIYGFANDFRVFLDINDPRSRDPDAVIAIVRAADVWVNGGGSAHPRAFSEVNARISSGGDGTLARPRQRMLMVTDGVQNERRIDTSGVWSLDAQTAAAPIFVMGPFGARMSSVFTDTCNTIKGKGAEIAIVHVRYINPSRVAGVTVDPVALTEFSFIENSLTPAMPSTLGSCASSPQFYADANTPAEIHAAVQSAFSIARRTAVTN